MVKRIYGILCVHRVCACILNCSGIHVTCESRDEMLHGKSPVPGCVGSGEKKRST